MVRLLVTDLVESLEKCLKALEVRSTLDIYNSVIFRFIGNRLELLSLGRYSLLTIKLDIEVVDAIEATYCILKDDIEKLVQLCNKVDGVVELHIDNNKLNIVCGKRNISLVLYGVDGINYLDELDETNVLSLNYKDYSNIGDIYIKDDYILSTNNLIILTHKLKSLFSSYIWYKRLARLTLHLVSTNTVELNIDIDNKLLVLHNNNLRFIMVLKESSSLDITDILNNLELLGAYKVVKGKELVNYVHLDNIVILDFKGNTLNIIGNIYSTELDCLNLDGTSNRISIGTLNLKDIINKFSSKDLIFRVYNSKDNYILLEISEDYGYLVGYIVGKVV